MAERTCPCCATKKPAIEFYRNRSRLDGLSTYCKPCTRSLRTERYRDTIRAQQAAWRAANPERVAEHDRHYRQANPEKIRAKAARARLDNPDQVRAYGRAADANRRAKRKGIAGKVTAAGIAARWAYFGGRCWMCGTAADTSDHVKPLEAGGLNVHANIRPACAPCNDKKRARWPYPLGVAHGCSTAHRQSA